MKYKVRGDASLDRQAPCSKARCSRGAKVVAFAFAALSMILAAIGQAQGPSRMARVGLLGGGLTQGAFRQAAAFLAFRDALAQQG